MAKATENKIPEKKKLWELTDDQLQLSVQLTALERKFEEAGGEVSDADYDKYLGLVDESTQNAEEVKAKVLRTAIVRESKIDEAAKIKAELDRIGEIVKGLTISLKGKLRTIDSLEQYVAHQLLKLGVEEVEDGVHRVKRYDYPSVEVLDERDVPRNYVTVETIPEQTVEKIDKKAMLAEYRVRIEAAKALDSEVEEIPGTMVKFSRKIKFW